MFQKGLDDSFQLLFNRVSAPHVHVTNYGCVGSGCSCDLLVMHYVVCAQLYNNMFSVCRTTAKDQFVISLEWGLAD